MADDAADRRVINVDAASMPSVVHVGSGLLEKIPSELNPDNGIKASKYVLVSDHNVWRLYGTRVTAAFHAAGYLTAPPSSLGAFAVMNSCSCQAPDCTNLNTGEGGKKTLFCFQVPPGEGSKSRATKNKIEDFMFANRCNRDTCMLAFGGGVVGDLVGFVAATYMRGVPVVQIPTSTTAMIDSSVGGKTAINVPAGKNLVGAFHQPLLVYADMQLLQTLPRRELVEGIAEAIKMGCIRLKALFDLLESNVEKVMSLDKAVISEVIYEAVRMKAEVVTLDERESGIRSTLNFGHTIGHAIEALMSPQMMHGECVSVGCVAEAELAMALGHTGMSRDKIERITKCFASYGTRTNTVPIVPTLLPACMLPS